MLNERHNIWKFKIMKNKNKDVALDFIPYKCINCRYRTLDYRNCQYYNRCFGNERIIISRKNRKT